MFCDQFFEHKHTCYVSQKHLLTKKKFKKSNLIDLCKNVCCYHTGIWKTRYKASSD